MKNRTLPIVIESGARPILCLVSCTSGCYSQGTTYQEAIKNIKDTIQLHIEDRLAHGEEIPENVTVSLATVEVAV